MNIIPGVNVVKWVSATASATHGDGVGAFSSVTVIAQSDIRGTVNLISQLLKVSLEQLHFE